MKKLKEFIYESYDDYLKLSEDDKKKLLNLDLEYGKIALIARYETVCRRINNKDEEWDKFKNEFIDNNNKYYPKLDYDDFLYEQYDLKNRVNTLIDKFNKFNTILSKYYIDNLNTILFQIEYIENLNSDDYELSDNKKNAFDKELLDEAFKIIKETESYEQPDKDIYKRNKTGKFVKQKIQNALDEFGYDWKIIIDNKMPPRMGVNPEKTFRIRETAHFSDVDIESLIAHEIKGHVQKKWNAYQTGLFLFVFGLSGKNIFDEGMAIWNTFNLTMHHKPVAMFSIALSYISCYYCSKYDFCDAFTELKKLFEGKNVSDKRIFTQLLREKRSTIRTDRLGYWSGDIDYFRGYKMIDKMNTDERKKIIKWNVGPDQYYMIDAFEKFIKNNNLKPISNNRLELIKKDYKNLKE